MQALLRASNLHATPDISLSHFKALLIAPADPAAAPPGMVDSVADGGGAREETAEQRRERERQARKAALRDDPWSIVRKPAAAVLERDRYGALTLSLSLSLSLARAHTHTHVYTH